jgi:serine/threonine protein kinase
MLSSHYANPRYSAGFGLQEFARVAITLTNIVSALHAHQVIHRDLSAMNVLYSPMTLELRIIDFGLSTSFPNPSNPAGTTGDGPRDRNEPAQAHIVTVLLCYVVS